MSIVNPINIYAINLKFRIDRQQHILQQFENRKEFNLHIVEACEHQIGAVGLWKSIKQILQSLGSTKNDFIIICEDDHQFTSHYSKEYLFDCIFKAKEKKADILLGGASWFNEAVHINDSLFWVQKFTGLQFAIIFENFFNVLLEADFKESDVADRKISELTDNKFLIYPFISIQKEFGYSDVTVRNSKEGRVDQLFMKCSERLQKIMEVSLFYRKIDSQKGKEIDFTQFDGFSIPTFIIPLSKEPKMLEQLLKQFQDKPEFSLSIVDAIDDTRGSLSLWKSICKIVKLAMANDDDVIVICSDNHEFTENYSKEYLLKNILQAYDQGCSILNVGDVGRRNVVPLTSNRYWIHSFSSTQFIIIFKELFESLLEESFNENDIINDKFSQLTANKMILYPPISTLKEFKNSPFPNNINNGDNNHLRLFSDLSESLNILEVIKEVYERFIKV